MSEYVRRIGAGHMCITEKGERFRVEAWLQDMSDGAVEWTPLKARALRFFDAKEAHAARNELIRRAPRWHREDSTSRVRVVRTRLRG